MEEIFEDQERFEPLSDRDEWETEQVFRDHEGEEEERVPDCADTCQGYASSEGKCALGCRHVVWSYDVEDADR